MMNFMNEKCKMMSKTEIIVCLIGILMIIVYIVLPSITRTYFP